MSYHELLGLDREPFGNSPDPDFFHGSPRHAECLRRLEIAVRLRRGLSVVVGEVGTGKSTVCRRLIRTLGYDPDVLVHLLLDPSFADPRDFLAAVAVSFGILVDGEDSATRIREAIQEYLLQKGAAENKIVVLCVDEGQKISGECLEILRELLNFETNTHKLLQIVVFAQTEFSAMLAARKNLADRVNTRYDLRPLSFLETRRLIRTRLRLAAGEDLAGRDPDIFTEAALRAIHRATGGYPRRIMRLCHAALLEAVGREKTKVGVFEVRAARDMGDRDPGFSWRAALVAAVPVVAVLFMVLGPGRDRAAGLFEGGLLRLGEAISHFPENVPGYDDLRQTLASGEFFPWRQAEKAEVSAALADPAPEPAVPVQPEPAVPDTSLSELALPEKAVPAPAPEVAVAPLSEPAVPQAALAAEPVPAVSDTSLSELVLLGKAVIEPAPEVAVAPLSEPAVPQAVLAAEPVPAVSDTSLSELALLGKAVIEPAAPEPVSEPAAPDRSLSEAAPVEASLAAEMVRVVPEPSTIPKYPAREASRILAEAPSAAAVAVPGHEPAAPKPLDGEVEEVVIQVENSGPAPGLENVAAPVAVVSDAAPALPEVAGPPAVPMARVLAAKPPRTLGQVIMRPGWSLSKAASRLYGSGGKRVMAEVARANPDISDLNQVRPGELVIFPARVAPPPPENTHVVRLETLSGLDEAFSALSRIRDHVPDAVLFAQFSADAGLTFDVVLGHGYPDAATAAQALAGLPREVASRAGTVILYDPRAIYYSSLEPAGGKDGPAVLAKAVAQNAAIPEAGTTAR
ncbi:AAA family ATPase [Desulfolutivibrio sulfoxidireducens]|uniref:AAA family ATPase n=1 Tax=Desulfolutivibrio sulfoxidireducens TaxID=2773299 RepID=UPI001C40107A|nr:AAA family ATPase [Desulfolutivibrio sulfoxidireducens]